MDPFPETSLKPSLGTAFRRAQISAFIASAFDFATLIVLVEVAGLWYVAATACGSLVGAVMNFLLGRQWSFKSISGKLHWQALRYTFVSGLSLVMNSAGVYVFTDWVGIGYLGSRIITAVLVGVFFNFPLHHRFVFR